ncbi:MAG TPA: family 1 glycosylhydrolase [Candidatus Babeliales bacterium]|nr:family 1 glycosylhydrolase [Candidatus Babeliales bacterium]
MKFLHVLACLISFSNPLYLTADIKKWTQAEWNTIYSEPLLLPELCGVALSEYQVSGAHYCPHSNWAAWEAQGTHRGHPTIHNNECSGKACDFWQLWPQDISLIQDLGCNALRISIEWSAIESAEGEFCQEALQHYIDMIDALIAQGITPMITLHHFTHPQWFEDKGGFAQEANIFYFVRFCEYVFTHLADKVRLWCTINEIGPFVFEGYIEGVFPPGKVMALRQAALVMRNMLKAHCDVYRALKKLPHGQEAQIGLVHQYAPFESYSSYRSSMLKSVGTYTLLMALGSILPIGTYDHTLLINNRQIYSQGDVIPLSDNAIYKCLLATGTIIAGFNLLEKIPTAFMNYIFNDAMLHFLQTGTLFPYIPGWRMTIADAPQCYDFIGLNVYSRMVMRSRVCDALCLKPAPEPEFPVVYPSGKDGELMTSMPYAICPESLYEGIVQLSKLGKPIYITENGVADTYDVYRGMYIKSYLYALSKALYDGYDVRGYFYWSLLDNFEWNRGYSQKFGLYDVDLVTQKRTLKRGAQVYKDLIQTATRIRPVTVICNTSTTISAIDNLLFFILKKIFTKK